MTISDAMPYLWASSLRTPAPGNTATAPQAPGVENSLDFRIGPEHAPAEAMRRSNRFAAMVLPALLVGLPDSEVISESVLKVLTELVDIAARHRASVDLSGRVSCDGSHVMLTVGEMCRPLPAPEEEPGLYTVRRLADDFGQYRGDEGGYATWASVPV
ncbi:hypothetical protein [Streptomyces sp. NRRL S-146]|uniref:hypothetical protein n=1 Tax=Streptomyces sp. NRRL S-146 TaxID=1463884 RepID=UPI0004C8BF0D|nr:hypothetical protein [Streptomyces sp. NRRL S-146]